MAINEIIASVSDSRCLLGAHGGGTIDVLMSPGSSSARVGVKEKGRDTVGRGRASSGGAVAQMGNMVDAASTAAARTGRSLRKPNRNGILFLFLATGPSACQDDDMPVVARSRYIELATSRNDVICSGTLPYSDEYLDMVFSELGLSPPDRRFVRYEWVEPAVDEAGIAESGGAMVQHAQGSSVVTTSRLLHEHELAHAVHFQAWPTTRPLFHEGFAVLFDSHNGYSQDEWSMDDALDPLLEDGSLDRHEYAGAWFLVSQIVRDHGMEGLRELWHAVPPDASAEQVRQAYQDLFGRSVDALIEPRETYEGGPVSERLPCYYVICDEPQPWDGAVWRAEGPFACAEDPDALGPMGANGTAVERHHVVELEPATTYRFTASGGAGTYLRACGLQCLPLGSPALPFFPDEPRSRSDLRGGRYRVEILADFEELPVDAPGTFEIERLD